MDSFQIVQFLQYEGAGNISSLQPEHHHVQNCSQPSQNTNDNQNTLTQTYQRHHQLQFAQIRS